MKWGDTRGARKIRTEIRDTQNNRRAASPPLNDDDVWWWWWCWWWCCPVVRSQMNCVQIRINARGKWDLIKSEMKPIQDNVHAFGVVLFASRHPRDINAKAKCRNIVVRNGASRSNGEIGNAFDPEVLGQNKDKRVDRFVGSSFAVNGRLTMSNLSHTKTFRFAEKSTRNSFCTQPSAESIVL